METKLEIPDVKNCRYCGKELPSEAIFCYYCRRELVTRPERPAVEQKPVKFAGWIWVLLVIVALVVFLFLR